MTILGSLQNELSRWHEGKDQVLMEVESIRQNGMIIRDNYIQLWGCQSTSVYPASYSRVNLIFNHLKSAIFISWLMNLSQLQCIYRAFWFNQGQIKKKKILELLRSSRSFKCSSGLTEAIWNMREHSNSRLGPGSLQESKYEHKTSLSLLQM